MILSKTTKCAQAAGYETLYVPLPLSQLFFLTPPPCLPAPSRRFYRLSYLSPFFTGLDSIKSYHFNFLLNSFLTRKLISFGFNSHTNMFLFHFKLFFISCWYNNDRFLIYLTLRLERQWIYVTFNRNKAQQCNENRLLFNSYPNSCFNSHFSFSTVFHSDNKT